MTCKTLVLIGITLLMLTIGVASQAQSVDAAQPARKQWLTSGNAATDPSLNFLGTTDDQPLIFKRNDSEVMRLAPDGSVGIGTTSPRAEPTGALIPQRLDVSSDSGEVGIAVGPTIDSFGWLSIYGGTPGTFWHLSKRTSAQNDRFGLSYYDGTSYSNEFLTIATDGNVGIGTTGPTAKLDIRDSGTEFQVSLIGGIVGLHNGGGTQDFRFYKDEVGDPDYDNDPEAAALMTLKQSGNVGIGTTSPTEKLHVDGNALADAHLTPSSRRWKNNINPIEEPLDKVQLLRGVSFDWKTNGKHDIGLIAEEVAEVIPEVVAYEENGQDAQSIDYSRLVAVLIEALKEQQDEIDQLKTRVSELESIK